MAVQLSTALRNYVLTTGSLRAPFDGTGALLALYVGAIPATADATPGGFLAVINDVTLDPLLFAAGLSSGKLVKSASQTWRGDVLASGTMTYFRLQSYASDTYVIQGTIGLTGSGADLEFNNVAITYTSPGADNILISAFSIELPLI